MNLFEETVDSGEQWQTRRLLAARRRVTTLVAAVAVAATLLPQPPLPHMTILECPRHTSGRDDDRSGQTTIRLAGWFAGWPKNDLFALLMKDLYCGWRSDREESETDGPR